MLLFGFCCWPLRKTRVNKVQEWRCLKVFLRQGFERWFEKQRTEHTN